MSQKLNVDSFKTDGNTFEFSKDFIENYNKILMEDIYLKLSFNILKNYMNFITIYPFNLKK